MMGISMYKIRTKPLHIQLQIDTYWNAETL